MVRRIALVLSAAQRVFLVLVSVLALHLLTLRDAISYMQCLYCAMLCRYGIPSDDAALFEKALKSRVSDRFDQHKDLLHHVGHTARQFMLTLTLIST